VLRIINVLKLADSPVILDEIVLATARFPDLNEAAFTAREGTIYGFYQAHYGINVVRINERLSAAHPDARTADLLGIRAASPVLVIKRVAYTITTNRSRCARAGSIPSGTST
jgi:GntR family transcriptional regulator